MKKTHFFISLLLLYNACYASYEIDFSVGETKNTSPLIYQIEVQKMILSGGEKFVDPKGTLGEFYNDKVYNEPKIGDRVLPGQYLNFKVINDSYNELLEESFSEIVFNVLDSRDNVLGTATLAWSYKGGKVKFIDSGESAFFFSPFQRQLPHISKGKYKYRYEVSLIKN